MVMITTAIPVKSAKQFATIWVAALSFFCPRRMLIRGAPPTPIQLAKEDMSVTTGPQIPTPARARAPIPSMFPMYMRSTMLYSTFTN